MLNLLCCSIPSEGETIAEIKWFCLISVDGKTTIREYDSLQVNMGLVEIKMNEELQKVC